MLNLSTSIDAEIQTFFDQQMCLNKSSLRSVTTLLEFSLDKVLILILVLRPYYSTRHC